MSNDRKLAPAQENGESARLFAAKVAARLARLRDIAVLEQDEPARARLARDRPKKPEPLEHAVGRRLSELRALCALTSHLQRAKRQ